jgi:hypothetical protein
MKNVALVTFAHPRITQLTATLKTQAVPSAVACKLSIVFQTLQIMEINTGIHVFYPVFTVVATPLLQATPLGNVGSPS